MSAISLAVTAILAGDDALALLLTGGVYDWAALGRLGLSRDNTLTGGAFDATTGLLKPCAVVRTRSMAPDGQIDSADGDATSLRETVETWLYQDDGMDTIEAAAARVFALLHHQRAAAHTLRFFASGVRTFDDLLGAFLVRDTYVAARLNVG